MCVIIDADVASRVFANSPNEDFLPLWNWIENKEGKMVFGGKNGSELYKLRGVRERIQELWKAGLALRVGKNRIDPEKLAIDRLGTCKSNDTHVLALARASGARVLCTNDKNLESDFKNRDLVPSPKGKIYKNADHQRLLGHNSICLGRPRR